MSIPRNNNTKDNFQKTTLNPPDRHQNIEPKQGTIRLGGCITRLRAQHSDGGNGGGWADLSPTLLKIPPSSHF